MQKGLFFGTFNPVHRGHESLADSFLTFGQLDELWIIPTPSPPHKSIHDLASFEHRWNMLQIAFKGREDLKLCAVEKEIPAPHYTLKTLDYISGKNPGKELLLCIGADTLQTLSSWYQYKEIAPLASLLVAARPGVSREIPKELKGFQIHWCKHTETDVSSSAIRSDLSKGVTPPESKLHPDVAAYINRHKLYGRG
ncbi:nicotinate (nicotinamide) nucleotide adenylyltransferase [Balneolaceae bacterium ANBcel3]|nr:nicotinate (nicotinamide) nucleotide adenylyltransferase [Balneolaceae bacterium ANBcel3]